MATKITPELADANWFLRTVALIPTVNEVEVALGVMRWAVEVGVKVIVVVVAGLTPRSPAEVRATAIGVDEATF